MIDVTSSFKGFSQPVSEIIDDIHRRGWTVKVQVKDGQYVAEGKSPHKEALEATGRTDATAAANLLVKVMRKEHMRGGALRAKLGTWDHQPIEQQLSAIAQAYAGAPVYEPKAAPAWMELAQDCGRRAQTIRTQLAVEYTDDPVPYESANDMREDVTKKRHILVTRAFAHHPIWSEQQMLDYRLVVDVLGHTLGGADWGWHGTCLAFAALAPQLAESPQKALYSELLGQAAYGSFYRNWGPQKICFLEDLVQKAQEQENKPGHSGVHPSQSIVPGAMPSIFSAVAGVGTHESFDPWEPGSWGKGLMDNDGYYHLWKTSQSGSPHHADYVEGAGLLDDDGQYYVQGEDKDYMPYWAQSPIDIAPTGHYTHANGLNFGGAPDGHEQEFADQQPGLKYVEDHADWWAHHGPEASSPGFGHGRNVLDILDRNERQSAALGADPNADWESGVQPLQDNAYLWQRQDGVDPLNAQGLTDSLHPLETGITRMHPEMAKQAVVNALRSSLMGTRTNAKGHAIHYQDLMNIPADVDDPMAYQDALEQQREAWNQARGYAPGSHKQYWPEEQQFKQWVKAANPQLDDGEVQRLAKRELLHMLSEEEERILAQDEGEQLPAEVVEYEAYEGMKRRLKGLTKPSVDQKVDFGDDHLWHEARLAFKFPGNISEAPGLTADGLVPDTLPEYVYRTMSLPHFEQSWREGYHQSDGRNNYPAQAANDPQWVGPAGEEGTVAGRWAYPGYLPSGQDEVATPMANHGVIVKIRALPEDGWERHPDDEEGGYWRTFKPIPVDRFHAWTAPMRLQDVFEGKADPLMPTYVNETTHHAAGQWHEAGWSNAPTSSNPEAYASMPRPGNYADYLEHFRRRWTLAELNEEQRNLPETGRGWPQANWSKALHRVIDEHNNPELTPPFPQLDRWSQQPKQWPGTPEDGIEKTSTHHAAASTPHIPGQWHEASESVRPCPLCGGEVRDWPDDGFAACDNCGRTFRDGEGPWRPTPPSVDLPDKPPPGHPSTWHDSKTSIHYAAAPRRYFHSTQEELQPGDILRPAAQGYGDNAGSARALGYDPNYVYLFDERHWQQPDSDPYYPNGMANTYEVEPLGSLQQDPEGDELRKHYEARHGHPFTHLYNPEDGTKPVVEGCPECLKDTQDIAVGPEWYHPYNWRTTHARVIGPVDWEDPGLQPKTSTFHADMYPPYLTSRMRPLAQISRHAQALTEAARQDLLNHKGHGHHFRSTALGLGIPGVGPRQVSNAWLHLAPQTSQLGIINPEVAETLGHDYADTTNRDYFKHERELAAGRDASGYNHIPLGPFSAGLWDLYAGGPGWHPDRTPFKPYSPTPHHQVDWDAQTPPMTGWPQPYWWESTAKARQQVGQDFDRSVAVDHPRDAVPFQKSAAGQLQVIHIPDEENMYGGYEGRRPTTWDSVRNVLYVGPDKDTHWNVEAQIPDWEDHSSRWVGGWLGPNPEAHEVYHARSIVENEDEPNEIGWYGVSGTAPSPEVIEAHRQLAAGNPYTPPQEPQPFGHGQNVLDSINRRQTSVGRVPWVAHPATGQRVTGAPGTSLMQHLKDTFGHEGAAEVWNGQDYEVGKGPAGILSRTSMAEQSGDLKATAPSEDNHGTIAKVTTAESEWQAGLCDAYALALLQEHPELRLGGTGTADFGPMHWFAHDDAHAYDSLGRHPLPYYGVQNQFDQNWLDQDPGYWGLPENGGPADVERARQEIQARPQGT